MSTFEKVQSKIKTENWSKMLKNGLKTAKKC